MRAWILLFTLLIFAACVMQPSEPSPIAVAILTPTSLDNQYKAERLQVKYDEAEEIAARIFRRHGCSDEYAETVAHNAVDQGLNVRIVSALIVVESTCRPSIVSSEGAVGLMQVSPKTWHISSVALKDPEFNIQTGTAILASYTRQHGVVEGLHYYNGLGVGCTACDPNYEDRVLSVAGYRR